jgi:antitoxin PrlF
MNDKEKALFSDAMTEDGQITIPLEIREMLQIKPGNKLKFIVKETGEIVVTKKKPVSDVFGILGPVSDEVREKLKGKSVEEIIEESRAEYGKERYDCQDKDED